MSRYNLHMPEVTNHYREPLKRPLTQHERDLIRWLIEHGDPGATHLLSQLDRLSVAGKCTCGCPTIDFELDGEIVSPKGERVVSDWLAKVDGEPVGVMLFEANGKINSLEVYSCSGSKEPFGLPSIDSIFDESAGI